MKYEQLAKDIIKNVGGKENVKSVVHCITRLRFKLKDESKANTEALKSMDGVVTVMKSGGQYQVVIGNHVSDVYQSVVEIGGFQAPSPDQEDSGEKQNLFNRFIDIIAAIFTPVLGVLAASGMIKGFNALFASLGWLDPADGTYQILNAVGDALFFFFPIFLGYTAMKKFGGSPFIGMGIGAALVYPALSTVPTTTEPLYTLFTGTMFESPVHITFLGIPVILMTYSSSVIPIILASMFAAKVEKFFKKTVPDVIKTFIVPFGTLLVVVPLTFIIIGPIATWAGNLLGAATTGVFNLSPIIAGAFIGGFWQVFVMFGLHWGLVPIAINNMATYGADPVLAMMFTASFAQTGAVLGVWLKTRDQKTKTLSIPAFISGIFGVTEPAIYGITLPRKKPFIISCIAGAIGGSFLGVFGSQLFIMGGLGIFGIPSFISPEGMDASFYGMIGSIILAFILGFVLTYLFGVGKEDAITETPVQDTVAEKEFDVTATQVIASPISGQVKALSEVNDKAFSSGAMGQGVAITPAEGKVFAPVSGSVTALFPTNHAIGITTDLGAQILIHIGMDTVQLNGKFFTAHVAQGDRIEEGALLIEFDITEIQKAGYSLDTPVIVTNSDEYNVLTPTQEKTVKANQTLITINDDGIEENPAV